MYKTVALLYSTECIMQVDCWIISIVLLQNTGYSDFHSSILCSTTGGAGFGI